MVIYVICFILLGPLIIQTISTEAAMIHVFAFLTIFLVDTG